MKRRSQGRVQRAPAPYTKFKKHPFKYSEAHARWKADNMGGKNNQRMGRN